MMKVNLIGDYEGSYRISRIEWVLVVVNVVLTRLVLFVRT
jgi:hypothetical protein